MNLTVGPLPPAVYWRRRAIVLGIVVLALILLVTTCTAGSGDDAKHSAANTSSASPTTLASPPSGIAPIVGGSVAASGSPSASAAANTVPAAGSDQCTDAEMRLTPGFRKIVGGTVPYELTLAIKNVSSRTCKRDVGAVPQEMHIVLNGTTIWSTDYCQSSNPPPNPDVRTFGPNDEASFAIGWDGTAGTGCNNPGHPVAAGTYQLVARLDSAASSPITFTIAGK